MVGVKIKNIAALFTIPLRLRWEAHLEKKLDIIVILAPVGIMNKILVKD